MTKDIQSTQGNVITTIPRRIFIYDPSFWLLLISNLVAIYFIIKNNVPVQSVMLIYWLQSIIIGAVNVVRILLLKNFSTENVQINGRAAANTESTRYFIAGFFIVHFGLFHLVYLAFISSGTITGSSNLEWAPALSVASGFLISHIFSFIYNLKTEIEGKNIGTVMFAPYLRIVPMHLAIILGAGMSLVALNILLILKTIIDLGSHIVKHK
ncbi:MAG: DUF6498-containing protein [Candidatus Falkowbacteria bacterium]